MNLKCLKEQLRNWVNLRLSMGMVNSDKLEKIKWMKAKNLAKKKWRLY